MWVLTGKSESGDQYDCIEKWEEKPSDEQIANALIDNLGDDTPEAYAQDEEGPAPFPGGEFFYVRDGIRYINYVGWRLICV